MTDLKHDIVLKIDLEGKVESGRQNLANAFKLFKGKYITLSIQRRKKTRSSSQNGYWWLLMGILADSIGYDKDEIHDICKTMFLKITRYIGKVNATGVPVILAKDGEVYIDISTEEHYLREELSPDLEETFKIGSTAILTTMEFGEMVDKLREWSASFLKIELPLPKQQLKMDV